MKAEVHPREQMSPAGLARLRTIGSTGSPLPVDGYEWVYREVKPEVLLASISGGTDPCAAFVGCCPILPLLPARCRRAHWVALSMPTTPPASR